MSERKPIDTKNLRTALIKLRPLLEAQLGAFCDEHPGITLKLGNATFNPDERTFKFQLLGTAEGAAEAKADKERDIYEQLRKVFALPTHTYKPDPTTGKMSVTEVPGQELPPVGTKVRVNGEDVEIVGALGGRAKYNILVRKPNGDRTRYQDEAIARCWARQKPEGVK